MLLFTLSLQDVKAVREHKEYRKLDGVRKKVVSYLISEMQDLLENDRMAYNKNSRRQTEVKLFELRFNTYEGLYVSTIHKFGSMRIKFFNIRKSTEVESTIEAIQDVFQILKCEVILAPERFDRNNKQLEIVYKLQKEDPQ